MKRTPNCNCLGPPKRAVDGAVVGCCALTFGKNPVGQEIANGFVASAKDDVEVQKLAMESAPKPLLVFRVTL